MQVRKEERMNERKDTTDRKIESVPKTEGERPRHQRKSQRRESVCARADRTPPAAPLVVISVYNSFISEQHPSLYPPVPHTHTISFSPLNSKTNGPRGPSPKADSSRREDR